MFAYFLEGVDDRTHLSADLLRDRGLGETLRDCIRRPQDIQRHLLPGTNNAHGSNGPHGASGIVIQPDLTPATATDWPNFEWIKVDAGYSLGVDRRTPITPADLRRNTPLIEGVEVLLGDGNVWIAPICRQPGWQPIEPPPEDPEACAFEMTDGINKLPERYSYNAAGDLVSQIKREWSEAWTKAGEMFEAFFGMRELTNPEYLDYCVWMLGLNYRIGPQEASALELLDSENFMDVFLAAFDGDMITAHIATVSEQCNELLQTELAAAPAEKKSGGSGTCSGDELITPIGSTEGPAATDQHTQTSGSPRELASTRRR